MDFNPFDGGLWLQAVSTFHDYWNALLHPDFVRPLLFLTFPVLLFLASLWGKRQITIRHSSLAPHTGTFSWSTLTALSYLFLVLCLANLNIAISGPQVADTVVQHLINTRDICVVNDSSGSMTTVLKDGVKDVSDDEAKANNDPKGVTVDSGNNNKLFVGGAKPDDPSKPMTRIRAAQLAARYLIRNRMTSDPYNTDRFCLMRFDDDLYELAPLTNDKVALMLRTTHITENVGGGTNFVVALKKAYDYFVDNSAPDSTRVLVINTDGYDSIDPEKRKEYIAMYKEAHIKLYVIGLGEGWTSQTPDKLLDLQKFADELHATDKTSGIVFQASNPGQMQKAMEAIDSQEKNQEVFETLETSREVDGVFILASILCALFFFGLATAAGRIP
jgi:hypothetical protein